MSNTPLILGKFASPYGVHGWIKVVSYTDPIDNLLDYPEWKIEKKSHQWENLTIEAAKVHGRFLVVKLKGYDQPETVKVLTNCTIGVDRNAFPTLPAEEWYWTDLIGLQVVNKKGVTLGRVTELFETGSNDVLVVKDTQHKELLIPTLSSVIQSVDLTQQVLTVDWDPDDLC